jgi:hypothetical protein
MEVENENRIGSIRVESAKENQSLVRRVNRPVPALIERAFITHESSARAELCDVEAVNVCLEIHD